MIRKLIFFILTILFMGEAQASSHLLCASLLAPKPPLEMKSTDGLIAYLGILLESRVINDEELSQLIESLLKGKVINPISEKKAAVSMSAQIHRDGLQKYVDDPDLEQKLLLEWAQATHAERTRVQAVREEVSAVTQDPYLRMEFILVPAGTFLMGYGQMEVTFDQPFEIMSTPLTQKMWSEVMGENPSQFKDGDHGVTVMINGRSIQMQPDHPVEQVSWRDLKKFVKKLNALDPHYDYRLPTNAEWEYAARGGTDTVYSFGDDWRDLPTYAWHAQNSNDQTHPVAELRPNRFGLYDMQGNVWEWVLDLNGWSLAVARGGSYCDNGWDMEINQSKIREHPDSCIHYVGARLVRMPK